MSSAISVTAFAQNDSADFNIDSLAARLSSSAPSDALSASDKTDMQDATTLALQQLEQTQARAQLVAGYIEAANGSNAALAELAGEISAVVSTAAGTPDNTALLNSEAGMRSSLVLLVAELAGTEVALEDLRATQTRLAARGSLIVSEIPAIRADLPDLEIAVAAGSAAAAGSIAFAQQSLALARLLDRRRAVVDLQTELNSIPARQLIVERRVELAELRVANLASRIDALTRNLDSTREGRAATAVIAAETALQNLTRASLPVRDIAAENLRLAQLLDSMAAEQRKIDLESAVLRTHISALEKSRQVVERVLATGRLPDALGVLLREIRARQLPIAPLEQRARRNDDARIAQELNPIIWQEQLQGLSDPDSVNVMLTAAHASSNDRLVLSDEERAATLALSAERTTLLTELIDSARFSRDRLIDQAVLLTRLITQTRQITDLLDKRLLWLRNQDPITRDWIANLPAGVAWLLNPRAWQEALQHLLQQIVKNPLWALLGFTPPLLLLLSRKRLLRTSAALTGNVGHVGRDSYWCTPLALMILCLSALPWPLLIGAVAGMLLLGDTISPFTVALIPSLLTLSTVTFLLILFRMLSQPQGIFEGHFNWSQPALRKLYVSLAWFFWVQCGATFTFTMAVNSMESTIRYSLGLLSFVVLSIGTSVMAWVFLNTHNGILVRASDEMEVAVWRKLIFPFLVAIPFLIGLIPLFGYFDTAVLLQSMVLQSGLLLLLVAVFHGVILRMLQVAHRRFSLRQIRQIRARTAARRAASRLSRLSPDPEGPSTDSDGLPEHVEQMSQQLRSTLFSATLLLFCVGLWFIWRPLIPTIGIANDVVLWQGTDMVNGLAVSHGITLWNLCVALLFLFGGLYLARNIRGFLDVGLFGQLSLDAGARYAAVSITGYLIVAVTALIGLAQLGIDWSKMQWIVAALGVGLGFGLQEIVANFVSGLIILFERPVRVGDIVTIGTLTGTVSKISIRATTVMDFDNREVLLPNKSIITDIVVNWTLNNPVTRIVIKIGVAYGSDLNQVRDILLGIAVAHTDVLDTPAPLVFLIEHGDSSINFEARVFVSSPVMRWPVAHDLNVAINAALADNGIRIPFPQRDVHIFQQPA